MSIQAVAWALEQDLPARPKLVLVSLCNHANNVDGYCWLKAETIAKESACTPRSVYRFVGGLVRNGYIRKVLRKGEDGKQRATDYWILFNRDEAEWDWGAHPDEDGAESGGTDEPSSEAEDTISCEPHERISDGSPGDHDDTRQPEKTPAVSPGPSDNGVTRKRIAEPSKINPKARSADASAPATAPRAYRPPPVEPQAADTSQPIKPIFVYENSRAYDAWAKVEAKKSGIRHWHLVTRALQDGQWRSGWYFPTLFPPESKPSSTDPPKESSAA